MRCVKCSGCMMSAYGETKCINCGYRDGDLNRVVGREGVACEPTGDPLPCRDCRVTPRMRHRTLCASCLRKNSARMQRKRKGMATHGLQGLVKVK